MVSLFAHGSRDWHHNCKRKFHTAHYQKFQCIVKHCKSRNRFCLQQEALCEAVPPGMEIPYSLLHLVCVAVDVSIFTVVYHETFWMCFSPAWVVLVLNGVYHSDRRFHNWVWRSSKKVMVVQPGTYLVNDGCYSCGYHVSVVITLFKLTSCNVGA